MSISSFTVATVGALFTNKVWDLMGYLSPNLFNDCLVYITRWQFMSMYCRIFLHQNKFTLLVPFSMFLEYPCKDTCQIKFLIILWMNWSNKFQNNRMKVFWIKVAVWNMEPLLWDWCSGCLRQWGCAPCWFRARRCLAVLQQCSGACRDGENALRRMLAVGLESTLDPLAQACYLCTLSVSFLGLDPPLSPFFLVFYVTKSPVRPIFFCVFVKDLYVYIPFVFSQDG